jgi:hypothetical protein
MAGRSIYGRKTLITATARSRPDSWPWWVVTVVARLQIRYWHGT